MESPTRLYAALVPPAGAGLSGNGTEPGPDAAPGPRVRELRVTGTAEVRCPADRASVRVRVSSSKESVSEATGSVSRRLEYILQALRQHNVAEGDTSVRRFLHRDADLYSMDVEVVVTFCDFDKMERVCSILLEKLDRSVSVGTPQFYHSPECLSEMRQRSCTSAVDNAQQKASRVCQVLGQSLGSPLLVIEQATKEWRSEEAEEDGGPGPAPARLPHLPTITASSQVSVTFSLRGRSRKKL
ncbi:interleukin-1 receptor-associated kinase 1-binding protein 1 homolog [Salarias fasciatus]|uniref:interleukin-1 receptor-associated kinase 1-binding protein 1 homolog n=1 Tax=Salarias fasciatus TaxID=181472 RepID=UPI0011768DC9|nr:interleukin-1 receptor-associated kinase 1-binding protein 1 [Salarias fasciatus]